jgi:exopolysaccharide production protein ExoZ
MSRPQRFADVQLLRAIAAMLVVVGHALYELQYLPGSEYLGWEKTIRYGAGVDLFFVISGFIMVYISADRRGVTAAQRFLASRILRIVPIYWLLTATWTSFALLQPAIHLVRSIDLRAILASFLFLPVPDAHTLSNLPLLYPGWSLNYEIFFYALFALALLAPGKRGIVAVIGVLGMLFVADAIWNPSGPVLGFFVNNAVLSFGYGMVIALAVPILRRIPVSFGALLIATGVALFVAVHFSPRYLPSFVYGGFGALIVAGAVSLDLRGRSTRSRPLIALGNASYSLYLCHLFAIQGLRIALVAAGIRMAPLLFVIVSVGLSVALAVMLHLMIELPFQRISHRLRVRRDDAPAARPVATAG